MVASLVGDPARANMLTALMTGRALTASELAHEAGVTPQTASSHLSKLEAGGLIEQQKQGRHRYYHLTGPDVASVLEGLEGLAARAGHMRVRTGPKDPALRRARICYDHLAGDLGVQMLDSMKKQRLVRQSKLAIELTGEGRRFMAEALQIDAGTLTHPRRPVCKACLDWSERRHHLASRAGPRATLRGGRFAHDDGCRSPGLHCQAPALESVCRRWNFWAPAYVISIRRLNMAAFFLWCILFILCWPLALLAVVLFPVVWLITLPLRILGIAVHGAFALLAALFFLPVRVLRGPRAI